MMTYAVRVVVRATGERLPLLVGPDRMADADGALYATCKLRSGASFNTRVAALRGVAALRQFSDHRGIDLRHRCCTGLLLTSAEWSAFQVFIGSGVQLETRVALERSALAYVTFFARRSIPSCADPTLVAAHILRADASALTCEALIPEVARVDGARDGLKAEQLQLLGAVLRDEAALRELWPGPAARSRNHLILLWLLLLGHRAGEALSCRIGDVALGAEPTLSVVKRPDDPTDPRRLAPRVKGLGRDVSVSDELSGALARWLAARARLPFGVANDFLLVSTIDGAPMSRSALALVFERLGEGYPALRGVTPHVLRHTWVSVCRRIAGAGSPAEQAEAAKVMALAAGWADPASERFYGKRQRDEAADAVRRSLQEALLEAAGFGVGASRRPA